MTHSVETTRMIRSGRGFRCAGGFDKPVSVADLVDFECRELGNRHVLSDSCRVLGLPVSMLALRQAHPDDKAVWLGVREAVRDRYCRASSNPDDPGYEVISEPDVFRIPKCAKLLVDLGYDGALFLYPAGCSWE